MEKDLRARTKQFALRIIKMFVKLPRTDVARALGKQALRAGTSVGANYREASRARSKAEFISKTGDCLREADETDYWLELLVDSGQVPPEKMTALLAETRELIAILTTINRKAKAFSLYTSAFLREAHAQRVEKLTHFAKITPSVPHFPNVFDCSTTWHPGCS